MKSPAWCLDKTCRAICSSPAITGLPGESQFCGGRLPEVLVTERGGVRHENDARLCLKTPRGITMFEVNEGDFQLLARISMRAIADYDPEAAFNARWFTGRDDWRARKEDDRG